MKKLPWITIPIATLVVLVMIRVPIVVEHYAENWSREQGVSATEIGDVDFGHFSGVLRVESLSLPGSAMQR